MTLNWMPDHSNNYLYSVRGDGTATIDVYSINGPVATYPRWDVLNYKPVAGAAGPETFTTGTCALYDPTDEPSIIIYSNASMRLRALEWRQDNSTASGILNYAGYRANLQPAGTYAGVDGVATVGSPVAYVRTMDGNTYYYFAKHSERTFMRIPRTV